MNRPQGLVERRALLNVPIVFRWSYSVFPIGRKIHSSTRPGRLAEPLTLPRSSCRLRLRGSDDERRRNPYRRKGPDLVFDPARDRVLGTVAPEGPQTGFRRQGLRRPGPPTGATQGSRHPRLSVCPCPRGWIHAYPAPTAKTAFPEWPPNALWLLRAFVRCRSV